MTWLRLIRAAGVLALFWAVVWGLVGAALGLWRVLTLDWGFEIPFRLGIAVRLVFNAALLCAIAGAINGFAFATSLGILGRRLRGGLTSIVVGGLGALAGATIPMAYELRWRNLPALPAMLMIAAILGALGACTALGTLAIARAGGAVADVGPAGRIR